MLRIPTGALRPPLTTTVCSCSRTRQSYYSSRSSASLFKPSANSASRQKKQHTRETTPGIFAENRCAQVTTWDLLKNPAEAFALVRAVEQKYGPVESFVFRKDSDSPSIYQTRVQITFRKIESFNRLPVLPEAFHIRGPKVQPKRPGGIGLDEIQPFITGDVEFLTADQVSEMGREERTIDFRIQRADGAYFSRSPFRQFAMHEKQRKAIGSKMLQWGGFHRMEPIDSTLPITNQDLTKETMDHVYMRRSLRDWAKQCGEPNPFELQPEETTEPVSAEPKVENEEKSELEQAPALDDWFSDVQRPNTVRDPMEQILEMEDIQVAKTPSAELHVADNSQSQQRTSLETTTSETTSALSLDDISSTTFPPSNSPGAISSEPDHISSSPTSSPSTTPSSPLVSTGPDSDISQSTYPSLDSTNSLPAPPTFSFKESGTGASRTGADTQRHDDDLRTSQDEFVEGVDPHSVKAQETKEVGAKLEGVADADVEKPGLKHDPRFNGLYDRLQDIIKGS